MFKKMYLHFAYAEYNLQFKNKRHICEWQSLYILSYLKPIKLYMA